MKGAPAAAKLDKNRKLMKACGSTTGRYDPESPEQTLWVLRNGAGEEKALAWIKTKTTFMSRSPFCVNESGQPLYIESMAAENGWTLKTAENYAYKLHSQGRIKLDPEGRRIFYRADVPLETTGERRTEEEWIDFVQSQIPPYVVEHIENLPKQSKATAWALLKSMVEWRKRFLADTVAQSRSIAAHVENITFAQIGVPKKRLPKRRPAAAGLVNITLKAEPDFVQSQSAEFVQIPEASLYTPETESVQSGASLLTSDPYPNSPQASSSEVEEQPETTTTAKPQSKSEQKFEQAYVAQQLGIDQDAARQVIQGCRQQDQTISKEVVVELGRRKLQQLQKRGNIANQVGMVIRAVPKMVVSSDHQEILRRLAQAKATAAAIPEPLPEDDPIVKEWRCEKCGIGMKARHRSGYETKCACEVRGAAGAA